MAQGINKPSVLKIALKLLLEYEGQGKYVNLSLSSHALDGLLPSERARLTALLYTSVEKKMKYDYWAAALSERAAEKITDRVKNILRLGFCQIADMGGIPDHAAVNETVKLCSNSGERAFVNGVLRRAVRERDTLPLPDPKKNFLRHLSVKYSFPLWIVKQFCSRLGEADTEKLLEAMSHVSPTDITVNTVKISVSEYKELLTKSDIDFTTYQSIPTTLRIDRSVDPRRLPGYSEGYFFVQDRSSAIACAVLDPKSGENVVDVCSAPGGKSFASAVRMHNEGSIKAYDIHESKLSLITGGAERLGIKIMEVCTRDARNADFPESGIADKVICDVPCSGLGVLAKKADLRYKDRSDTEALPALQYDILRSASRLLRVGGRLLYSTCTLSGSENEEVIDRFLSENKDYIAVPFKLGELSGEDGKLTLYPHIHKTDGFFISLIERVN